MKENKTETMTIRMTPTLKELIEEAKGEDEKKSEYVRRILKNEVGRDT